MKFSATVLALFCLAVPPLAAQDNARTVKFRVLCYEHVNGVIEGFAPAAGGNKVPVNFYTGGIGPQIEGRFAGDRAVLFAEKPGPDGKTVRTVLADGKLDSSPLQLFLLLPENKKQPDGPIYRLLAFDDSEAKFPMGATRVINLAPHDIRLNLAGADLEPIKPGGMKVYPQVKTVDEWNMFTARVDFLADEQWVAVATQSWKASDRKRDWVITQINPLTKSPAISLYQDIPPWREAQLPVGGGGNP
jgi:hypothetical protein